MSSALRVCKRLEVLRGDRLVLPGHLQHLRALVLCCPRPTAALLCPWPGTQPTLSVSSQGSLGDRVPPRSPRSTRTRCWCCGSLRRAKPPAPTRWSAGWTVCGTASRPPAAAARKMGSHGDTKPGQKCPMSLLSPGAQWGPRSGVGDRGLPPAPGLPLPHLAPAPAGEDEWKIISTGIADCYFNVTELPPGSAAKFRVACVNKAGQGPYSTPSGKVHLEAAGEQALFCRAWGSRGVSCGAEASGMLWGSLSPRGSFPQGFGEQGAACTPLLDYPCLAHTSLCSLQMPELLQPRTSLSPSPSPSPSPRRWLPAGRPRHPWGSWSHRPWGPPPPRRPASTREQCRRQKGWHRRMSPPGSSSPLRPARRGHSRTLSSHPTSPSACLRS